MDLWRRITNRFYNIDVDKIKNISFTDCFSLLENVPQLLSTSSSNNSRDKDLSILHGIRVLFTFKVLMFHAWLIFGGPYFTSCNENVNGTAWWFQGISNFTITPDTFLVISGLLVSYHFLRHLDTSSGKILILRLYIRRYLRYFIY